MWNYESGSGQFDGKRMQKRQGVKLQVCGARRIGIELLSNSGMKLVRTAGRRTASAELLGL